MQEPPPLSPRERIIVACDCNNEQELSGIVADLAEFVGTFKIGLELITSVGLVRAAQLVRMLGGSHVRIMVDGKYCDIPNTMKASIRNVDAVQGRSFTIHANVGPKALLRTLKDPAFTFNSEALGVTVLTSHDDESCEQVFGRKVNTMVRRFALQLAELGAKGIVCSPKEVKLLRKIRALDKMRLITPGVRPEWWVDPKDDQARPATPAQAILDGADELVIGRPILKPPPGMKIATLTHYRVDAAKRIAEEIGNALLPKRRAA
jgi:orotidine-5'-phosphate decarboxylase